MEVLAKLRSEIKKMVFEEEELKEELGAVKSELMVENLNLKLLEKDSEIIAQKKETIQSALDSSKCQLDNLNQFRETIRKSSIMFYFFTKFIDRAEPASERQRQMYQELQAKYEKMLSRYEEGPTYQSILQKEAEGRELDEKIAEVRGQVMKLRTKVEEEEEGEKEQQQQVGQEEVADD